MKRLSIFLFLSALTVSASALELSLSECREMALLTDENVKIADNKVAEADFDRAIARTAYLPNFGATGGLVYSTPDTDLGGIMTMQMHGTYLAGISLTQPIYAGGKITAANKMAAVGKEISKEQQRATRMDVIADAERSYWTYVAVLAKVDMMKSYLAMMDSVYGMTQLSVKTGLASRQTLLRVEARRSEIIYRLQQAISGADLCRMALCRVIGVADTVAVKPTESIDVDFDMSLPANTLSLDNRPEISILRKNIDIKKQDVNMARADFLPAVGLQLGWSAYGNIKINSMTQDQDGNYVPVSSTMSSNGFTGMVAVQIPLFHWGEGVKKVKKARLEVENARLSLERNRRLMQLEVNRNYSNLVTSVSLINSAQTAMAEAEENLQIMQEQYEVGLSTLTDLLEAQSQWHSSYSNLIEARTQYRICHVDFLRSIGALE